MSVEVRELLDRYTAWLREKSVTKDLGDGYTEITTPYLDRHNDYIQIYVRAHADGYLLTDGGETIQDLRLSGCDLDTKRRKELLHQTLRGFGANLDGEAIHIRATSRNFPLRKHNLVQAILGVNDLFYLAAPVVASLFLEDVTAWLTSCGVRFTPRAKFTGKSGYDHNFDFVIPQSISQPERLLRAIGKPNRDMALTLAFSWVDVRDERPVSSHFLAFLNDAEAQPVADVAEALRSYEITPILWSERERFRDELTS